MFYDEKNLSIIAWSLLLLSVPLFYQSCGPTTTNLQDRGVLGGSLNLTTSAFVYDYNFGKIDTEISHYDDLYNVNTIDLLNPEDGRLHPITYRIAENQKFVIILTNAEYNSGFALRLNEDHYFVQDYQKLSRQFIAGDKNALPQFTPLTLKNAKLILLDHAFKESKITATRTDCVAMNHPGPKGEYRNGSLTLQAIGHDLMSFNTVTWSAARSAKLLWEVALFRDSPTGECF